MASALYWIASPDYIATAECQNCKFYIQARLNRGHGKGWFSFEMLGRTVPITCACLKFQVHQSVGMLSPILRRTFDGSSGQSGALDLKTFLLPTVDPPVSGKFFY